MAETDSRILEYLEEGLFLYGVGKVQESITRWRKVLELDPKNERAMDYIESAGGDVSAFRARAAGAAGPVGSVAAPAPAPAPKAAAPAPRPAPPAFVTPPAAAPVAAPQATATPPGLPTAETRKDLLAKAAALYRAKYYEAALEILERIARDHPPIDETLRDYLDAARTGMTETLKTQWSRTDLVPRPRLGPAQIMQLKLSPEAGFMLSRIDGMSSVDEIISMAGLDQFTALRALNVLLQQGAIELTQR